MRDDMLFIDGELVDMDDNTKVTLNYKSNIFSDLSKIVSNNSYTIKLPGTVHNQRIFGHADLPASGSTYPRVFHKARYFRNGVEILSDALAVLISSGETFDVALTWGNAAVFEPLVKSEKKLNELKDSGEYLVWNKEAGYGNYEQGNYLYSKANYGVDMNADGANVWAFPAVRIPFIIGLIENEYGVKINIPYQQNTLTNRLLTLCETKKESDLVLKNNPFKLAFRRLGLGLIDRYIMFTQSSDQSTNYIGEVFDVTVGREAYSVFKQKSKSDSMNLSCSATIKASGVSIVEPNNTFIEVLHKKSDGTELTRRFSGYASLTSPLSIDITFQTEFQSDENSELFFKVIPQPGATISDDVLFTSNIWFKAGGNIGYGGRFPIIPNLPNIKVVDFLKNITQMVGLFASPNISDKSISFFNVDKIIGNKRYAIDVTTRVIAETKENRPRGIKYTIDGLARNNRFDYKRNDELKGDYSGVITVADETIYFEKDAVKMEFGASDEYRGLAEVPIYEYDKDGKINEKNIDARIFAEEGWSGKSELHFDSETSPDSLSWNELIPKYYRGYQEIVSSPIIINEKIELTDIELKTLDMTIPFYLGQYGRYYAIISVKAEDTGICECQLLQLEV